MAKSIKEAIEKEPKDYTFEERARKWEEEIKPLCEKWGVIPGATINATQDGIFPAVAIRDIWQKEQSSAQ